MSNASVSRSVRIPAEIDRELVAEAERLDRSVSWVIVDAIRRATLSAPEILERAEMNRRVVERELRKSDLQRQIDEEPDPRGVRTQPSPPPVEKPGKEIFRCPRPNCTRSYLGPHECPNHGVAMVGTGRVI